MDKISPQGWDTQLKEIKPGNLSFLNKVEIKRNKITIQELKSKFHIRKGIEEMVTDIKLSIIKNHGGLLTVSEMYTHLYWK